MLGFDYTNFSREAVFKKKCHYSASLTVLVQSKKQCKESRHIQEVCFLAPKALAKYTLGGLEKGGGS